MNYFYLSLGSNLAPASNLAKAIETLVAETQACLLLPIVKTQPCQMESEHLFLNTLVICASSLTAPAFKDFTNQLEVQQGRDRNDPLRGAKDRPIDIDTVACIPVNQQALTLAPFTTESAPYIQAPLQAASLQATALATNSATQIHTTPIQLSQGAWIGHRAAAIYADNRSGHIRVVEDTVHRLLQSFEASFKG